MEHGLFIAGETDLEAALLVVRRAPRRAALLCDIDGTIAPIVRRPDDAVVPPRTRELLAGLVRRIGLVAFVTGRGLDDGRRMIPLDGAVYVGTHGLERLDGDGTRLLEPDAEPYVAVIQEIAEAATRDLDVAAQGLVIENKRTVVAVHYRLAADKGAAERAILAKVVEPARARGLTISTGHFVYEVRPPVPVNKGTATARLLREGDYLAGLFCGDDLTDVTGFAAIHEWGAGQRFRAACAVAAVTAETPPEVTAGADVLVRATGGVSEVLGRLLEAAGG
jgi:trehalose 6-phosphate phosphatase